MSQRIASPTSSSSSTLIVFPFPLVNNHLNRILTKKPPDLKLDITSSCSGWFCPDGDKRMSGKGFIEPHRNNLPRRKRRVVTAPVDGTATAHKIEKTFSHTPLPTSGAGPPTSPERRCLKDHLDDGIDRQDIKPGPSTAMPTPPLPIQIQSYASSSSQSSVQTNITEPPSSLPASPTPSASLQKSPALSRSSTTFPNYPTFQTPKRALFRGRHLDEASLVTTLSPPPITPTKGHLQPTSATLPRRHRSLVLSMARERERKRRSITEQQTTLAAVQQSQELNDAWKEVASRRIRQTTADADTNMTNSNSRSLRRIESMCSQKLGKGVMLGFLTEGDGYDENIVRIKVYDDESTTPLCSPQVSPSPSPSLTTLDSSSSSKLYHLQFPLPTDPFSYTDGTTSLTDSQIQQACAFIDEHISIPESSKKNNNTPQPARISVLILTPRTRPEEAMSIGISYLAGIKETTEIEETEGDEKSDDHDGDGHAYSTVHRLIMAFHDDPGSPILPNHSMKESEQPSKLSSLARCGIDIDTDIWRGLRPEWRGVLSFDGMQRLDKVWTSRRS